MKPINLNPYTLTQMVSVYTSPRDSNEEGFDRYPFYLETHEVYVENGKPRLREGKPLTESQFEDLRNLLDTHKRKKERQANLNGPIGSVIYADLSLEDHTIAWRYQGRAEKLMFDKSAGLPNGELSVPDLIFIATRQENLRVFATLEGRIYHAPFLNVHEDGDICLGTINLKAVKNATTFETYCNHWERIFFDSKFSEGVAIKDKSIIKITKDCILKKKPYPLDQLKQLPEDPKTIEELLTKLSDGEFS